MPNGRMTLVSAWTQGSDSEMESHMLGIKHTVNTQTSSIGQRLLRMVFSECFIYAEYKGSLATGYAIVKTDIGKVFEFPAIPNTGVW